MVREEMFVGCHVKDEERGNFAIFIMLSFLHPYKTFAFVPIIPTILIDLSSLPLPSFLP
jgi:hypothetical protein